jgi:hypothetical protein
VRDRVPPKEAEILMVADRAAIEKGPGTFRHIQEIVYKGRHLS